MYKIAGILPVFLNYHSYSISWSMRFIKDSLFSNAFFFFWQLLNLSVRLRKSGFFLEFGISFWEKLSLWAISGFLGLQDPYFFLLHQETHFVIFSLIIDSRRILLFFDVSANVRKLFVRKFLIRSRRTPCFEKKIIFQNERLAWSSYEKRLIKYVNKLYF